MKKLIITMTSFLCFTSIFATTYHIIYSSQDGNVKIYIIQKISIKKKTSVAYVSKFNIRSDNCSITEKAGKTRGHLNTGISLNFATFGWETPKNKNIQGAVAYSNIKSYMETNVEWSNLSKLGCHIKAGKATLPLVQQH